MPYVSQAARQYLDKKFPVGLGESMTAGELNYVINRLLIAYVRPSNERTYERINAAIGVLECTKMEFYRRIAVPYEQLKLQENGDLPYNIPSGGGIV